MIKALMKLGIEALYIIKAINNKCIASILLNGEKLNPFPLKSETRQGCPRSPLLVNAVFEFLAGAIRQEEKRNSNRKERSQISLFADDMILYPKDWKAPLKNSS
jgi:hypothetical protein